MKLKLEQDDYNFARRHNSELLKQHLADDKKREQEIVRRRAEWDTTPDSEKLCDVCTLPLDDVAKARINASPLEFRRHDFCKDVWSQSQNIRGLVGLLREAYGAEDIPADSLRKVIEVWRAQKGFCAISRIRLDFPAPAEEKQAIEARTGYSYQSALSSFDNAIIQREREKEQHQKDRHSALHSPVFDYDAEGKLRLISRTVARWKDGLSDEEFLNLVRTLHSEMTPAFPVSRSHNHFSPVGAMTARRVR